MIAANCSHSLVDVVDRGDADVLVVVVVVGVLGDRDRDGDLDGKVDDGRLGVVVAAAAAAPTCNGEKWFFF